MEWVPPFLLALGLYLAVGLALGSLFVIWGVQRVDHAAAGASWRFRVLILPGCAALWPWVLLRWMRAQRRHSA